MAITHTFKGSYKNGYYAYIEDNKLVIGEDHVREGGETYRGVFGNATRSLRNLEKEDLRLYNSIMKYYSENHDTNETRLSFLKPGNKFIRLSGKDPDFKDDTTYMLIDMEVSKCFVFGEKLSGFVTALDLNNFKVYIFDKTTEVKLIQEKR